MAKTPKIQSVATGNTFATTDESNINCPIEDASYEVVPFQPGMTLNPGQSVTIPVTLVEEQVIDGGGTAFDWSVTDISGIVYDRYQHCTKDKETGLWYSDADIAWSGVKPNALPCPQQDTPELTQRALDAWCRQPEALVPQAYLAMVAQARATYTPPPPPESAKSMASRVIAAIFRKT